MLLIGEEEAANIMTNLNPEEVKSLGTAMYQVQDIDQDTVNMVLDEFLQIIKANTAWALAQPTIFLQLCQKL